MAESLFYRLKNPHKYYPDNISEEELQMIGLGYDRLVRFMDKDDPNLKHPYYWSGIRRSGRQLSKLSDEDKSKCLEFLLGNHPMLLLHPYTKEWKAKLEEMELGCDAPDDNDDVRKVGGDFIDWVEEERNDEEEDPDDVILDVKDARDEVLGIQEDESLEPEEDDKYWEEEFKKALRSNEAMEKLVEKSIDATEKYYEDMGIQKKEREEGDELEMRGKRAKLLDLLLTEILLRRLFLPDMPYWKGKLVERDDVLAIGM
ncbi:hypothetical protein SASPL_135841 [Salvia splendens]|uniref:Uncharacterized protein n=1 Tax=Salvia splendens TaxID=180675 RepID=A0A8X8WYV6_SALSN|nr:hypothetical protein SASPL_135841 [Salvia splendens]